MNRPRSSATLDALAKSVRRRRRQRRSLPVHEGLPIAKPVCERQETLPKSIARVLGPYANGEKWRLVLLEGVSRKSLVADTFEAALKLRDDLLGRIKAHVTRTFGDALDDYLADIESRGFQ